MTTTKKRKAKAAPAFIDKPSLTLRELQVAIGISDGMIYEEIGTRLQLSVETVRAYVKGLRDKTGRRRKTQLAIWSSQHRQWLDNELRRETEMNKK